MRKRTRMCVRRMNDFEGNVLLISDIGRSGLEIRRQFY